MMDGYTIQKAGALRGRGVSWQHVSAQVGVNELTLRRYFDGVCEEAPTAIKTPLVAILKPPKPPPKRVRVRVKLPPPKMLTKGSRESSVLIEIAKRPGTALEVYHRMKFAKSLQLHMVNGAVWNLAKKGFITKAGKTGKTEIARHITPEGVAALLVIGVVV